MDFIEAMKKALLALQHACSMNDQWVNCKVCPFSKYCDVIEEAGLGTPEGYDLI